METPEVLSAAVAQTNGGFRNRIHFSRFRWSRRITSAPLSDRHRLLHFPASTLGITSHFSPRHTKSSTLTFPLLYHLSWQSCSTLCSGRRGEPFDASLFFFFRQLSVWMNPSLDLHRIVTMGKSAGASGVYFASLATLLFLIHDGTILDHLSPPRLPACTSITDSSLDPQRRQSVALSLVHDGLGVYLVIVSWRGRLHPSGLHDVHHLRQGATERYRALSACSKMLDTTLSSPDPSFNRLVFDHSLAFPPGLFGRALAFPCSIHGFQGLTRAIHMAFKSRQAPLNQRPRTSRLICHEKDKETSSG